MSQKREQKYQNRLIAFMIVIIMLVFAYVCCGSIAKGKQMEQKEETAPGEILISYTGIEEYRVQSFNTLSSIAVKYIPSDKYMSKWISDVKRLNNRKSNDIYFDEVIRVYVYEK